MSKGKWTRGRGQGRGRGRGRGRGGSARGRSRKGLGAGKIGSLPFDLASFAEFSAATPSSDDDVRAPERQRGGKKTRGQRGKRGGSYSVTSHNRVPFNYNTRQVKPPLPEEADKLQLEKELEKQDFQKNSSKNREKTEDEEDKDEDVVIAPHKSYKKSIPHRRKLEGLVVDEYKHVSEKREYNAMALMRHSNPLRRPVLFVRASGSFDKSGRLEPSPSDEPESRPATMEPAHEKKDSLEAPNSASMYASVSEGNVGSLSLSDLVVDNSEERAEEVTMPDDDEFLSFKLADQILESNTKGKPVSEQDAILADWMENAMMSDSDDVPMPALHALSDPCGEHTTLEDIAIDAQERENMAWESDSDKEEDRDSDKDDDHEDDTDDDDDDDDEDDDMDDIFDESLHELMLSKHSQTSSLQAEQSEEERFDSILRGSFSNKHCPDPSRVPARKSKKMPDFRDSLWANELQGQWEKDRSKKAAKKQQRAAARQAADYDPYPNTHGHYNSTKITKKQRRLEKRQRRAQLKSLADYAEDGQVVAQAPKSFADICAYIDEFLLDESHTTLTLPPLGKRDRAVVHNMAGAYALKSKSHGKGTERFPVLMKTSRTGHFVDYARLKRLSRIPFALSEREWDAHPGLGGGGVRIEVGRRHKDGTHVGKGAKQISEDNIGHKLLRSMGWSSGQGIGQAGGRTEPVQATVKITRSGLGM